jgi:hypothetical protein
MKAVSNQEQNEHTASAPGSGHVATGARAKLDVGFAGFESNLTAMVVADIRNATSQPPWTAPMKETLVANVTKAVTQSLNQRFTPLKKSIGKTWMALPQDEQKDAYVAQLKSGFADVFASSLATIENHVRLGLRHFALLTRTQHLSPVELVARSEAGVSESLLGEHCYGDLPASRPHATKEAHGKGAMLIQEAKSAMLIQEAINEAFCIQSVVDGLVHHLNDTQMLISMTMRFQAGAMSLAQQKARKKL